MKFNPWMKQAGLWMSLVTVSASTFAPSVFAVSEKERAVTGPSEGRDESQVSDADNVLLGLVDVCETFSGMTVFLMGKSLQDLLLESNAFLKWNNLRGQREILKNLPRNKLTTLKKSTALGYHLGSVFKWVGGTAAVVSSVDLALRSYNAVMGERSSRFPIIDKAKYVYNRLNKSELDSAPTPVASPAPAFSEEGK